jgi:hypothetical protein
MLLSNLLVLLPSPSPDFPLLDCALLLLASLCWFPCHFWCLCCCWRPCCCRLPYCCEGPWFRIPTPTGVSIVAGVPASVSIPPVAAWLPYSLLASSTFPHAACILTILPPAFLLTGVLLMLASCWCLRPAVAGVTTVAGVTAVADAPTFARVPVLLAFLRMLLSLPLLVSLLVLLIRSYRKFDILISWNPPWHVATGQWPYHYVLIFIAHKPKIMGSKPTLYKSFSGKSNK